MTIHKITLTYETDDERKADDFEADLRRAVMPMRLYGKMEIEHERWDGAVALGDPAPDKPLPEPVLAQLILRLEVLESAKLPPSFGQAITGRVVALEKRSDDGHRSFAKIEKKLEDIVRRMQKVEQIAFEVQAKETIAKVDAWAKDNLNPPGASDQ